MAIGHDLVRDGAGNTVARHHDRARQSEAVLPFEKCCVLAAGELRAMPEDVMLQAIACHRHAGCART
jgi:hypothetical protein